MKIGERKLWEPPCWREMSPQAAGPLDAGPLPHGPGQPPSFLPTPVPHSPATTKAGAGSRAHRSLQNLLHDSRARQRGQPACSQAASLGREKRA